MSKFTFARSALLLTSAFGALALGGAAHAQEAGADAGQLDEIVVTAERRSENLQKVPVSVGVVQGDALRNLTAGGGDILELAARVPGLYAETTTGRIFPRFYIRGLGNIDFYLGASQPVSIIQDDVVLEHVVLKSNPVFDVNQVEVLRGPQGSLFGRNTTAGIIKFDTIRPSMDWEGRAQASYGSYNTVTFDGGIGGPIVADKLAFRVSALYQHRDDWVDNVYEGPSADGTVAPKKDAMGGYNEKDLRLQLLMTPTENVSMLTSVHARDYDGTSTIFHRAGLTKGSNSVSGEPRSKIALDEAMNNPQAYKTYGASENIAIDMGPVTLTSITAYRWWDFTPRNDDGLNVPVFYSAGVSVRDKQYSQEIRLASPTGGAFDYVLGAYYFKQDLDNKSFTFYGPQADIWNLTPAGALANVDTIGNGHIDTDSYALFAQGTWHITDRLDFTAGVRGTYEEKSAWVTRDAPTGGAAVTGAAAAARQGRVGAYDSGDLNQYSFSPSGLLGLSYRFNEQLLGYATLTHGEKSGGINLTVGAAPRLGTDSLLVGTERVNNAELGLKSSLFDDRLQLNTNLFWAEVHGYQANVYDQINRVQYLANAGRVRSRGLEFEATALPLRGLTVNFNGSWNDVRYTEYKDAPCPPEVSLANATATCDLSGHQVVGASKYIANLNTQYKWQASEHIEPYVTASYAFRSKAVGTIDDSDFGQIPSYALVNLSAGVRLDQGDGVVDLSLWVKNAGDKTYFTSLWNSANGGYAGVLGTPRTFGATARYDF